MRVSEHYSKASILIVMQGLKRYCIAEMHSNLLLKQVDPTSCPKSHLGFGLLQSPPCLCSQAGLAWGMHQHQIYSAIKELQRLFDSLHTAHLYPHICHPNKEGSCAPVDHRAVSLALADDESLTVDTGSDSKGSLTLGGPQARAGIGRVHLLCLTALQSPSA